MFVTAAVAALMTVLLAIGQDDLATGFKLRLVVWLWLTVLFGTFAEALAEGRGKATKAELAAMGKDFSSALRPAIVMTILFALLPGLAYPLAMTGIGQALFPAQANRSRVYDARATVVGSTVVGQAFAADRYFQTRPSAAGKGYDGLASSGSNLGPAARALVDRVKPDVARRRAEGVSGPVPADLVTASGSGLDPDRSPAAALAQASRVARVRRVPVERIRTLVADMTKAPLLGEPHVNVLALNRALDLLSGTGTSGARAR